VAPRSGFVWRGVADDIAANTLQASVMGDPIYHRMGYEEIYRYRGYLRVPTEKRVGTREDG
jgi:hypothetical protein